MRSLGTHLKVDISTAEMEIQDGHILIQRKFLHVACAYTGKLASDELSADGSYECNHVGVLCKWSARISDTPQVPPKKDWRGQVWQSYEGSNDWRDIWQRRGWSSLFDAEWRDVTNGGYDASALQVMINGDDVTVYRHQEKGHCTYLGKLQPDRRNLIGTVSCNWVNNALWRATILN